MRTPTARRILPMLPLLVVFTAASTGTVLASDVCGVSLVKTLTEAARSAQDHTSVTHRHTRATLAKWEVWGNLYLAKHGHPYVPPKHPARRVADFDAQEARFKLECELPPVPVADLTTFALLPPDELLPVPENMEVIPDVISTNMMPLAPGATTYGGYPGSPVLFGGGTGAPGPVLTPNLPPGVTPEPASWLLMATGAAAVFASFKSRKEVETAQA